MVYQEHATWQMRRDQGCKFEGSSSGTEAFWRTVVVPKCKAERIAWSEAVETDGLCKIMQASKSLREYSQTSSWQMHQGLQTPFLVNMWSTSNTSAAGPPSCALSHRVNHIFAFAAEVLQNVLQIFPHFPKSACACK